MEGAVDGAGIPEFQEREMGCNLIDDFERKRELLLLST